MFNETQNQTDESQEEQNPALPQSSKNLEERIEELNQSGNKSGKKKGMRSIIGIILLLIFFGGVAAGGYYFRDDIVNFFSSEKQTGIDIQNPIKKVFHDCSGEHLEFCDNDCQVDSDCKFTCGCGAINKNEVCQDKGIIYDCVDHYVSCENSKCILGEEKLQNENQIDTSDWQTYRNEEFGFEFKYPNTLLEPQKMSNSDYSFAFYPKETGGDRLIIGYTAKEKVDSSNAAECLKKIDNQNGESIKTFNTEATINWTKFTGTKMPIAHACIQYSDGGIVFLTFYLINNESKSTFRELISTFKFINQEKIVQNKKRADTDNDGLFDDEEAEYGCDINNPDSDGDGYLDGDEVENGYDPMGEGKL